MTAMLAENSRLESLQLTGSMIGSGAAWLADALSRKTEFTRAEWASFGVEELCAELVERAPLQA